MVNYLFSFISNKKWLYISLFFILILLCPIVSIFVASVQFNISTWEHLISTKLNLYIFNTLFLLFGVGLTSLFFGVSTAWIITKYNFPLSKTFEWALILPLAIPAYIVAYCYTDFFEYSGFLQTFIRNIFQYNSSKDYFFPEIRSMGGAIFVMSFVLYPYIFLITKIAFVSTPITLYELAKIHGKSTFFKVALPMARPGIVAGLALVLMETISDFGTVEFFAVETLTLGIFNLWLGMNDLAAASQVAIVAFIFIFFLLIVELVARKKQKFNDTQIKDFKSLKVDLNFFQRMSCSFFCFIPIFFGFLLPVLILIEQATSKRNNPDDLLNLFKISSNTLLIAGVSAIIIIVISTIMSLTVRYKGIKHLSALATAAGSGYAFPGIILALGTTYFFSFIQNFQIFSQLTIIGTFLALIFAYVSRFNAIGYGAINSGVLRVPPNILEASITLGHSYEKSILKTILPIIRPSILIAGVISFVDIVKELPITLILRPFNFETLSTYVYQYAKDEMFEDSAFAALLIVFAGLIPIFILNHIMKPEKMFKK